MRVISGTWQDRIGNELAQWYINKTGLYFSTSFSAIGWVSDGELNSVAVFTDYNGYNIELHYVGWRKLTKDKIRYISDYVFNQLKCIRLTVKVCKSDKYIVKYLLRLGMSYEGTLKRYHGLTPEFDALIYSILKEKMLDKWMK